MKTRQTPHADIFISVNIRKIFFSFGSKQRRALY